MQRRLLYATAWRELRATFAAALILVLTVAGSVAASFWLARKALSQGEVDVEWAALARVPNAYASFVDALWFRVPGASFVLALGAILIAARIPLRRRAPDTPFYLLLPLSRIELVWERVQILVVLVSALAFAASALFVIVGHSAFGETYPAGRAVIAAILATVGSLAWAGATVALASFIHRVIAGAAMLAVVYLVPFNLFQIQIPPRAKIEAPAVWNVWAVTDPAQWSASVPWVPLLLTLVLAIGGPLVAVWRLQRIDH